MKNHGWEVLNPDSCSQRNGLLAFGGCAVLLHPVTAAADGDNCDLCPTALYYMISVQTFLITSCLESLIWINSLQNDDTIRSCHHKSCLKPSASTKHSVLSSLITSRVENWHQPNAGKMWKRLVVFRHKVMISCWAAGWRIWTFIYQCLVDVHI